MTQGRIVRGFGLIVMGDRTHRVWQIASAFGELPSASKRRAVPRSSIAGKENPQDSPSRAAVTLQVPSKCQEATANPGGDQEQQ